MNWRVTFPSTVPRPLSELLFVLLLQHWCRAAVNPEVAAVNEGWWHYSHKYHGFRARAQLVNNLMNGDPLYIHWFPFWFLFVLSSFCEMSSGSWRTQTLAVLFTQVHIKGTDVKVGLNCCRPKQTSVWTIWFWWTATTWPGAWPFDLVSHNTPLVQPYVPGDGLSYWIEQSHFSSLMWRKLTVI